MAKINIESIREECQNNGWKLLSDEYKNLDTEMIFDYETGYRPGSNPYQSWNSNSLNFYCGNVYSREGSIIGMTTDSLDGEVKKYTSDEITILSLGTSKVYSILSPSALV